jgi:hypothetical protein
MLVIVKNCTQIEPATFVLVCFIGISNQLLNRLLTSLLVVKNGDYVVKNGYSIVVLRVQNRGTNREKEEMHKGWG